MNGCVLEKRTRFPKRLRPQEAESNGAVRQPSKELSEPSGLPLVSFDSQGGPTVSTQQIGMSVGIGVVYDVRTKRVTAFSSQCPPSRVRRSQRGESDVAASRTSESNSDGAHGVTAAAHTAVGVVG